VVGLGGEAARPTCKKCGFPGHLTFQCRNYLSANPLSSASHLLDVSSTSSEEDELQNETPLTKLRTEELQALRDKLRRKEEKKKRKKKKKKKEKEKEKEKRRRRHSSSSSSATSSSDDDDGSDDDDAEKKTKKKKKKDKKKKKKHRK